MELMDGMTHTAMQLESSTTTENGSQFGSRKANSMRSQDQFIKFQSTCDTNRTGTHDWGKFTIHSSTRLFDVFAVKQPDGSFVGNYHGDEETRVRLQEKKSQKLSFICGLYGVGGQSLTCDDGTKQEDGSWIYRGNYNCWSD
jgi:hypothetical protein